jgi:hypothetical protein
MFQKPKSILDAFSHHASHIKNRINIQRRMQLLAGSLYVCLAKLHTGNAGSRYTIHQACCFKMCAYSLLCGARAPSSIIKQPNHDRTIIFCPSLLSSISDIVWLS